jgi:hypothetical protein
MRRSKQKQLDGQSAELGCTVAKTLASEDIQLGDFVTILYLVVHGNQLCGGSLGGSCAPDFIRPVSESDLRKRNSI